MKFLKNTNSQFLFFIVLFFIVNFIQAYYTGLWHDEAYYWVWSKDLAFGYFDHPPMVALWIKISSLFFDGELGVRFFSIVSFSLTLVFIWLCIDDKRKSQYVWLYFLLIISVALLNIYGFITVPDTPLILFTAIFLYTYKRFLHTDTLIHSLLLGFAMAGMLYSKYHGVLIIAFVVLSNLSLLKTKKFWLAGLFGALLFLPHILWQVEHDFPSIKYHLFERSKQAYRFEYTYMHFLNLIAIVGLPFPIVYWAFFKQKADDIFKKGLKYIVWGFILFIFFSTFRTRTEGHWNQVILIPIIIICFRFFIEHVKMQKWLIYLGLGNLLIMVLLRIFLANETLSPVQWETHQGKIWAEHIKKQTKEKPVIFIASYQNASRYNFYTGIKTHSYSTLKTRKSQYDLGNFEQYMQHENVTIVGKKIAGYQLFKKGKDTYFGNDVTDYNSFQKIKCSFSQKQIILARNKKQQLSFEIYNPYNHVISFDTVNFAAVFQGKKNRLLAEIPIEIDTNFSIKAGEKKLINAYLNVPKDINSEMLTLRIVLKFYQMPAGFQGNKVNVLIKNDTSN